MTIATPNATSAYFVTIPIYSDVTVCLTDAPAGLSREAVLERIDFDMLRESDCVYPQKGKEYAQEALDAIAKRSAGIQIEEDNSD